MTTPNILLAARTAQQDQTTSNLDLAEIEKIAIAIKKAVIVTLRLENDERVFVGNEEKVFLYKIMSAMPIHSYKNKTFETMYDVFSKVGNVSGLRIKKSLLKKTIDLILFFVGEVKKIRSKSKYFSQLQRLSCILHFAAHLRQDKFTVPSLTLLFFKNKTKKNDCLRGKFLQNLILNGVENELACVIASLLPTSHLESYSEINSHPVANLRVNVVCSSVYGVMLDPLLASVVRNNSCRLVYVQHGGAYGLIYPLLHELEVLGADEMIWWGVGEHNVLPTRYAEKPSTLINERTMVLMSDDALPEEVDRYIKIRDELVSCIDSEFDIVMHPSMSFRYPQFQKGISDKDHESAKLIIYDSVFHSLLYARLLVRRPFLIAEREIVAPSHINGQRFIDSLRDSGLMLRPAELADQVNKWVALPNEQLAVEFEQRARFVFSLILNQPRLEDLFPQTN